MKKPEIIVPELKFERKKLAKLKQEEVEFIVVHHSGVSQDQSGRTIHNYHKDVKGWGGIGYHFYIRYLGEIYQGRPITKRGVHTRGINSRSVGICLAGNFNEEYLMERKEQYDSLVELLKWLKTQYLHTEIKFHLEFTSTSCPGNKFPREKLLEDVELDVDADSEGLDMEITEKENKEVVTPVIQRKVEGSLNGEKVNYENFLIDNRTYIPLRALEDWFEGVEVNWDENSKEFEIKTK